MSVMYVLSKLFEVILNNAIIVTISYIFMVLRICETGLLFSWDCCFQ